MATTKNITMKQFNGTDYDTLYPKTVYNQVSGVAPAGYGLGETLPYIAKTSESGEFDADTIDKTGFFAARTNTPTGNWCYGLHVNRTNNLAFQLLTSEFSEKEFALRKKISGVWQPWEWVNPPMKLGVEYRTTERYQGKPVYVKLVNFGKLPNATTKKVEYGDSVCLPIFGYGISSGTTFPTVSYGGALADSLNSGRVVSLWFNGNELSISCGGDRSEINAYVFVKYYKTTD